MARTSTVKLLGSFLLVGLIAGCASTKTESESEAKTTPAPAATTTKAKPAEARSEDSKIVGNIPRGSPFSKLALDMSQKQVYDLIGRPTDTKYYQTGKAWIPFYYGSDTSRFEALYKGQGRITFTTSRYSSESKVFRIEYDPTETGYGK
jgi:outer membrane protein assembly factor BamE (lipoprotein component of BamABCDE complex)